MGHTSAVGMKESVDEGLIPQSEALRWHLKYNHFPPYPEAMVAVAERAVEKANKGRWESCVRLPKEVSHRIYGRLVPVHVLVQSMHLEEFINPAEEDF